MSQLTAAAGAPPIVQYWHSKEVPDDVAVLIAGFRERNPDLHHRLFDAASAEEFIRERFGPRELAAFRSCAATAVQSDYLRYCAVLALGGIYADVDARCIAPLSDLLKRDEVGGVLFGWRELPPAFQTPEYEWRERVGPYRTIPNSLFTFRAAGHPLLRLALDLATANIENRVSEDAALVAGPGIFTSLYLMYELGSLEAFESYALGGVIDRLAPLMCEVVGDHARVERAFEDVQIRPMASASRWIGPSGPLAYKQTPAYWRNATTSIFVNRTPASSRAEPNGQGEISPDQA